jgi:hypothetical protein
MSSEDRDDDDFEFDASMAPGNPIMANQSQQIKILSTGREEQVG